MATLPWLPLRRGRPRARLSRLLAAGICVGIASLSGAAGGAGEDAAPGGSAGSAEARPPVDLDRLLQLPSSLEYTVERRGGLTAGEWRQRFQAVHEALAAERAALADAERRLEELAGRTDAWKVAPALPGVSAADEAPLDYGLRRELQRHRDEIERLERKLRELEIEADLAGVPPSWRHAAAPAGGPPADAPGNAPAAR